MDKLTSLSKLSFGEPVAEYERDGVFRNAPRDVINLLAFSRDRQITTIETGDPAPPDSLLIGGPALQHGARTASKMLLTQTLYAEDPDTRRYMEAFRGRELWWSPGDLPSLWEGGC